MLARDYFVPKQEKHKKETPDSTPSPQPMMAPLSLRFVMVSLSNHCWVLMDSQIKALTDSPHCSGIESGTPPIFKAIHRYGADGIRSQPTFILFSCLQKHLKNTLQKKHLKTPKTRAHSQNKKTMMAQ